jgi:arylformamidase
MVVSEGEPSLDPHLLAGAVTISALTELAALIDVSFLKDDLQLNAARVAVLSPARLRPALLLRKPLLVAVGAHESREFHRQSELLATAWGATLPCTVYDVPATNHLSVCDAFATPGHALFKATCALLA